MIGWKGLSSPVTEIPNPKLAEALERHHAESIKWLSYFMGTLPPEEMAEMKAKIEKEAEERSKYCPECGREW